MCFKLVKNIGSSTALEIAHGFRCLLPVGVLFLYHRCHYHISITCHPICELNQLLYLHRSMLLLTWFVKLTLIRTQCRYDFPCCVQIFYAHITVNASNSTTVQKDFSITSISFSRIFHNIFPFVCFTFTIFGYGSLYELCQTFR